MFYRTILAETSHITILLEMLNGNNTLGKVIFDKFMLSRSNLQRIFLGRYIYGQQGEGGCLVQKGFGGVKNRKLSRMNEGLKRETKIRRSSYEMTPIVT
jgi:hypothetical protein